MSAALVCALRNRSFFMRSMSASSTSQMVVDCSSARRVGHAAPGPQRWPSGAVCNSRAGQGHTMVASALVVAGPAFRPPLIGQNKAKAKPSTQDQRAPRRGAPGARQCLEAGKGTHATRNGRSSRPAKRTRRVDDVMVRRWMGRRRRRRRRRRRPLCRCPGTARRAQRRQEQQQEVQPEHHQRQRRQRQRQRRTSARPSRWPSGYGWPNRPWTRTQRSLTGADGARGTPPNAAPDFEAGAGQGGHRRPAQRPGRAAGRSRRPQAVQRRRGLSVRPQGPGEWSRRPTLTRVGHSIRRGRGV